MGLTLRQAGIEDVIRVTVESSKLVWAYRGPSRPPGIRSKKILLFSSRVKATGRVSFGNAAQPEPSL